MPEKPTYEEMEQRVQELEQIDSERKRTEKALLEIEERYNLLIQRSQTGIYIHVGGLLKFVNNRFARILGYVPNEMVGRQYWDFVHPEDKEMVKDISLARAKGEAAPLEYDFRHQSKNGETVWVHNLPTIIQYQGQTANMGNLIQIDDRKRAEEKLKESEERFRSLAENSIVGVNIIQDGIIKYVNLKFADIFGYSVDECLDNMPYQQLVHPEDLKIVQENIRKRISGEADSVYYTIRGIKKSGEKIHVEIFGSSIQFKGMAATYATILDISARLQAEQERETMVSELQKALRKVKLLDGLLPICSHCKKIRDDKGYWKQIDAYIEEHSEAEFSHSICTECADKYYPDMDLYDD